MERSPLLSRLSAWVAVSYYEDFRAGGHVCLQASLQFCQRTGLKFAGPLWYHRAIVMRSDEPK
jgi:hypothetical protein